MGSHIGNSRQLQQALDSAILTVFTVEHREYHVNALPHHAVTLEVQQALTPDGRNGSLPVFRAVLPLAGGQLGVVPAAIEHPVSGLGNAHGEDIVLLRIHIIENGFGAPEGNLMLRASAAEQNAYTKLLHNILTFCCPRRKAEPLPRGKYRLHPWSAQCRPPAQWSAGSR